MCEPFLTERRKRARIIMIDGLENELQNDLGTSLHLALSHHEPRPTRICQCQFLLREFRLLAGYRESNHDSRDGAVIVIRVIRVKSRNLRNRILPHCQWHDSLHPSKEIKPSTYGKGKIFILSSLEKLKEGLLRLKITIK